MASTEYFQFDTVGYAAALTQQHQHTLGYLLHKGYITPEMYDELIDTTIVSAIRNELTFGKRLLQKVFANKDPDNKSYVFLITEIAKLSETVKSPKKTKLEKVIDNVIPIKE